MGSTSIIHSIQGDDPSFDPLGNALAAAKVTRAQFDAAFDRVVVDGNFGPISPAEWREQDGREPSSVSDALALLGRVSAEVDDYREASEVFCEDESDYCGADYATCGGHTYFETTAEAEDLRREIFAKVIDIYGHLPF